MKRIFLLLLSLSLLLSLAPAAFAAGSASLSGPSVVRAGDTITLTFTAGGGIYGGSGSVSFDSSQLTLQSYKQTVGGSWAVEFNGNAFLFYDNNMNSPIEGSASIFQATFTVSPSLEAGTTVSVSANNVTLSDGKQDSAVGTCTYSAVLAAPLSSNADLASLTVSNGNLSPAFSPNVTTYNVSVPYSVTSLDLSAAAADSTAKVSITNPSLSAASTTTVSVTVTAENGSSKTYTIYATRSQDPNYVKSSNAKLSSLSVEGYQLSPAFSPDVTQYYIWLPYETEKVTLTGETEDRRASADKVESPTLTPAEPTKITFTVTAEDGTQLLYTVTAFRAPSHEDVEDFLYGKPEEPTEPATEPTTEPTTAPTTAPTAPPTTQAPTTPPTTAPVAQKDPPAPQNMIILYILGGIICASAGAVAGMLLTNSLNKRKHSR